MWSKAGLLKGDHRWRGGPNPAAKRELVGDRERKGMDERGRSPLGLRTRRKRKGKLVVRVGKLSFRKKGSKFNIPSRTRDVLARKSNSLKIAFKKASRWDQG